MIRKFSAQSLKQRLCWISIYSVILNNGGQTKIALIYYLLFIILFNDDKIYEVKLRGSKCVLVANEQRARGPGFL